MDTNKKSPSPTQIIEPLSFKKKSPPLYVPQKLSILSKINTPPHAKKVNLLNLHDLERFHKNCALNTL